MRIVVLAYNLIGAGALSVGKNIVDQLPKIAPNWELLMLVPEGRMYNLHENLSNVSVLEIPRTGLIKRLIFEKITLPKIVKSYHPDVVLCLGNIGLHHPPCKQAILIHQSQIVYSSDHYGPIPLMDCVKMWLIKRWVKKSLRHTDLIFCQTPVVRDRFSKVFSYPTEHIKIMPNAVSEFAKTEYSPENIPDVFKNNNNFKLFFLTRYYPHKNLEVLIDMFRNHQDKLRDVQCIITISPDCANAQRFLSQIQKYNLQKYIVNVGPLKQEELAAYFHNSDALLFPTLLESFSGTYLEAMHFGLPILTGDLDFARYICGDAALYFNPWEPADIAEKILLLKNRPEVRSQLIERGKLRISTFFKSWDEIVSNVIVEMEKLKS
jgi:glycosyltransferase involved in cell wall biosynthesis